MGSGNVVGSGYGNNTSDGRRKMFKNLRMVEVFNLMDVLSYTCGSKLVQRSIITSFCDSCS
jgi:hypothetical protein